MELYFAYSDFLKNKYGEKTYKLPVNIPVTCPNRINGGCTFCSEVGTGFEMLSNNISVSEQLTQNMEYIRKKYKANKFIAYFQNYTNTFLPFNQFKNYILEACQVEGIIEVAISTRPDCIYDEYLDFLYKLSKEYGVNICIELGLQSINVETLRKINRGHGVGDFVDAVQRIAKYEFDICVHMILNLPWDILEDAIDAAKLLSALPITQIKLHSLYIAKGTVMAYQYENNEIKICSKEEYIERAARFLGYLRKDIAVQRLLGRAPEEETLFCNWGTSWWKIRDDIEEYMITNNISQGSLRNYETPKF
ncbi:MAG: family radical protein [Clostridiales bacterium]|jgi:radical SAM protein (TIGR01212 family)|nr:family radical protein [Clostridiales bacterium]